MTKPSFNRRTSRKMAMQSLYQLSISELISVEEATLSAANVDESKGENEFYTLEDVADIKETVEGVLAHVAEIDERLNTAMHNWTVSRLTKVDRAILRLAVYEMFYISDEKVPKKVAINEAIELAKKFSDEKSSKFINGTLSHMLEK